MERENIDKVEQLDETMRKKRKRKKVRSKDVPAIFIEKNKELTDGTEETIELIDREKNLQKVKSETRHRLEKKKDLIANKDFEKLSDDYELVQYTDDDVDDYNDDDKSVWDEEECSDRGSYDGDEEDEIEENEEAAPKSPQSTQLEKEVGEANFLTVPSVEYNKSQKVSKFSFPIMDLPPEKNAIRRRRKDNGFAPSKKFQKIPKTIDEIDEESFTTRLSSRQSVFSSKTVDIFDSRASSRRSIRSIASDILSQITGINDWVEKSLKAERFSADLNKSNKFLSFFLYTNTYN